LKSSFSQSTGENAQPSWLVHYPATWISNSPHAQSQFLAAGMNVAPVPFLLAGPVLPVFVFSEPAWEGMETLMKKLIPTERRIMLQVFQLKHWHP